MKRVIRDLIYQKGLDGFKSVTPETSVGEALNVLELNDCSAIMVIQNNKLKGVFSENDFVRGTLGNGIKLSSAVNTVMTTRVYYAEPLYNLEECLQIMSKVGIRHLPVLDKGRPIGMVNMKHIVEILVNDKEAQIQQLTNYITGSNAPSVELNSALGSREPIFITNENKEIL